MPKKDRIAVEDREAGDDQALVFERFSPNGHLQRVIREQPSGP